MVVKQYFSVGIIKKNSDGSFGTFDKIVLGKFSETKIDTTNTFP